MSQISDNPFSQDLGTTKALETYDVGSHLKMFLSGGAPVPEVVARTARKSLRCSVACLFGMTEVGAVTLSRPTDPIAKQVGSDGRAQLGFETRVVDDESGKVVPSDTEGRRQW